MLETSRKTKWIAFITGIICCMLLLSVPTADTVWAKDAAQAKGSVPVQHISVNSKVSDRLVQDGDKKIYSITLAQDGRIQVDFSHGYYDNYNRYWSVGIYDAQMNLMTEIDSDGNEMSKSSAIVGLKAGTYNVQVSASYYGAGENFSLKVAYKESSAWEKEFNDNYNSKNIIPVNATRYGTAMEYEDEDYYMFSLPKRGYINLNFKHDYIDDNSDYWFVEIYNEEMKLIADQDIDGYNTSVNMGKIGLPTGNYYVKIKGRRYTATPYNFKVNYTASNVWETEFNDTYNANNVISIPVGSTRYGSTRRYEDDDYFYIKPSRDGYITFTIKHNYVDTNYTYWKVVVYNSSMKKILPEESYGYYDVEGEDSIVTLPKFKVKAGNKYYIRLYGIETGATYSISATYHFTNSTPYMKSLTSKSRKAYLSWNKVSGATGYKVYMSAGNNKNYKLVKTTKSSAYTKTGLAKGRKYYFKARAYKISGGKTYYSSYGASKSVTAK